MENQIRGEFGEALVQVVSRVLLELIATPTPANSDGMASSLSQPPSSKFHGQSPPAIGVSEYLGRISKFAGCSDECFVLGLIYIDRLFSKRRILLDKFNIHRLIVTSVMLAAKFFDDHYYDNNHYAMVGGITTGEINLLEIEFLFLMEFNLCVGPSDFDRYRMALYSKMQQQQIPPRLQY